MTTEPTRSDNRLAIPAPKYAYGVALLALAVATLVRSLLDPWLGDSAPFTMYIFAVVVSTWYGGVRPALLVTLLGFVLGWWFFLPVRYSLEIREVSQLISLIAYLFIGFAISGFGGSMRLAQLRAATAEHYASEQADYFRTLANSMPQMAFMTHPDGFVFWYNERWCEYTGKTVEQMEGWGWQSVHDPEELPKVIEQWKASLETAKPFDMVFPILGKDGVFRPFLTRILPLLDDAGRVTRWFGTSTDISEAKRAEEEVREARSRLESTLAAGEVGTWEFDIVNNVVRGDRNLATMFGVTEAEAAGGPLEAYTRAIHPDDRDRVASEIGKALEGDDNLQIEYRVIGANGQLRWIVVRGRVERNESGQAIRLPGVAVDITSQREAEDALRASEARRTLAMEAAELGAWNIDPATNTLTTDERFRTIFGVPGEEITYERAFAIVYPDDREIIREGLAAGTRPVNPIPYAAEYRVVHPDGTIHWVFAKGRASFGGKSSGQGPLSIDGTVADITDRKLAEEREQQLLTEAATANAKFRAFFDQGPLFAGVVTLEGRLIEANNLSLEACGYTRDQVVGKYFWECPWWAPSQSLVDQIKRASKLAATGETFRAEMPYFIADGSERIVDFILSPIKNEDGRVLFMAPTGTDVTQRHELEINLRQLASHLSEANRKKDEFLATLAHELRNPLAPIRNSLQILKLVEDDREAAEQAREIMERQLAHMVRLVDDLLDVSRITRGKLDLRLERIELSKVIEQAVETSRPAIDVAEQKLTVSLPPQPIVLNGDAVRLSQVLSNLLNNSCKYSERGGSITVDVAVSDQQAEISIKDTGIGIAPEMLPKIFDMFTQVDASLERSGGGLGIGLTLVKRLVELHNGTVTANSAGPGQGSEFIVRLPILTENTPAVSQPASGVDSGTTSRRILVVDDNQDSARTLALLLKKSGHEIQTAFDGIAAYQAAESSRPDVVLLDIGLPGLNGYEVARKIRDQSWGKSIVLIALTGWGQDEDRQKSQAAGFNAHLVKPVAFAALKELLAKLLAF